MGEPVTHLMEDDLERWVEVAALAGIIRFERLLRRHAEFEAWAKESPAISDGA